MKLPMLELAMQHLEEASESEIVMETYQDNDYCTNITPLPVLNNFENNYYLPMNETGWRNTDVQNQEQINTGLCGKSYREVENQVYSIKDDEIHKILIDATIKLTGVVKVWQTENQNEEWYICEVKNSYSNSSKICIESRRYKELFKEIRKSMPQIHVNETNSEAIQEYLTDRFNFACDIQRFGKKYVVETHSRLTLFQRNNKNIYSTDILNKRRLIFEVMEGENKWLLKEFNTDVNIAVNVRLVLLLTANLNLENVRLATALILMVLNRMFGKLFRSLKIN